MIRPDSHTVKAIKEAVQILGEHTGREMSDAPWRAVTVLRTELTRLGVHEQETHTRRPTVIGRG